MKMVKIKTCYNCIGCGCEPSNPDPNIETDCKSWLQLAKCPQIIVSKYKLENNIFHFEADGVETYVMSIEMTKKLINEYPEMLSYIKNPKILWDEEEENCNRCKDDEADKL